MKNSTKNIKFTSQILVLFISSTIAITVLIMSIWLYFSMKNEVEIFTNKEINKSTELIKELVSIHKKELNAIARSIALSPLLKSALNTKDSATVNDVLKDIRKFNELSFVNIIENKTILYSNNQIFENKIINEVTPNHVIGFSKIDNTSSLLIIGVEINNSIIQKWEEITSAKIITSDKNKNIKIGQKYYAAKTIENYNYLDVIENKKIHYFIKSLKILNDSYNVHLLIEKSSFYKNFKRKRNTLLIIGITLFFIGILLSILVTRIVLPIIYQNTNTTEDNTLQIDKIIKEIESCKNELLGK